MSLFHIVLVSFKPEVSQEVIKDALTRNMALKDICLHPTTQKPYIKSMTSGVDNSTVGLQHGMTHAFVVELANAEDRDYFTKEDPAHKAYGQSVASYLDKVLVFDFVDGEFCK
ncbi:hypothetical protein D8B26_006769 [Coccidioides posadasii str. Silveira]|uniref:Uncharacterized protein n=3 Tax=Coccidioides posadasii TaxID=199306 RepID=E9CRJ4_COCPS|nr:hypothetical protein CPC735_034410 [Coccidioides posadasii C735 delta SOWgp]EER28105.1 hypothetical protein CPC735_034410 [Coccidioides posadasii C735 delta SOWgp]EFW23272.1 hypothetical protein CPSG_01171 [Coccidioides posadasii str. Silveira]KMM68143.1 hypothetical protein CPAG_04475 [Coccidioides posadasii RMSCC 3488]QVM12134.1 hypothetical protein D8B26_006769 [Coccidioides posadasii str. Silveira]|eukprot:XP_003070250.1 hypothetical protein CPC735_034410 [Coccidioides posadasii C735 delta SOWgp]